VKSAAGLRRTWHQCLEDFVRQVARKNIDPADVIVRAAFTKCNSQEIDYVFQSTIEGNSVITDNTRKSAADDLTVIILEERAN
jgi:hypothetical protein